MGAIYILFAIYITAMPIKTTEGAGSDSCPVSNTTVEIVKKCPETEKDWNDAAARKNCFQYADQCDQPDKLLYHCVINPYVNQTLEVCAYVQNILWGYCAEYNILGNLIQANYKTNCLIFNQNPCPEFYRSKDAFLYPGCFELVKNSTASSSVSTVSSTTFSLDITGRDTTPPNGDRTTNDDNTEGKTTLKIALTMGILVSLLIVFIIIVLVWKRKKKNFCGKKSTKNNAKGNYDGTENEGYQLQGKSATEEGEGMITPSGQAFGTGQSKKGVVQTEDDEQEHLLNEEPNREKQECEELVEILNETIKRIVLTRREDEGNLKDEDILHQIYKNPSCFENESNQNIREKAEKLKALEEYFLRKKASEIIVEMKDEGAIQSDSSSENF